MHSTKKYVFLNIDKKNILINIIKSSYLILVSHITLICKRCIINEAVSLRNSKCTAWKKIGKGRF